MPASTIVWTEGFTSAGAPPTKKRKDTPAEHKHSPEEWEFYRNKIMELFEENELIDVAAIMGQEDGFKASIPQYRNRLKNWRHWKYLKLTEKQWRFIGARLVQREQEGKEKTAFKLNGKKIPSSRLERDFDRKLDEEDFEIGSIISGVSSCNITAYTSSTVNGVRPSQPIPLRRNSTLEDFHRQPVQPLYSPARSVVSDLSTVIEGSVLEDAEPRESRASLRNQIKFLGDTLESICSKNTEEANRLLAGLKLAEEKVQFMRAYVSDKGKDSEVFQEFIGHVHELKVHVHRLYDENQRYRRDVAISKVSHNADMKRKHRQLTEVESQSSAQSVKESEEGLDFDDGVISNTRFSLEAGVHQILAPEAPRHRSEVITTFESSATVRKDLTLRNGQSLASFRVSHSETDPPKEDSYRPISAAMIDNFGRILQKYPYGDSFSISKASADDKSWVIHCDDCQTSEEWIFTETHLVGTYTGDRYLNVGSILRRYERDHIAKGVHRNNVLFRTLGKPTWARCENWGGTDSFELAVELDEQGPERERVTGGGDNDEAQGRELSASGNGHDSEGDESPLVTNVAAAIEPETTGLREGLARLGENVKVAAGVMVDLPIGDRPPRHVSIQEPDDAAVDAEDSLHSNAGYNEDDDDDDMLSVSDVLHEGLWTENKDSGYYTDDGGSEMSVDTINCADVKG